MTGTKGNLYADATLPAVSGRCRIRADRMCPTAGHRVSGSARPEPGTVESAIGNRLLGIVLSLKIPGPGGDRLVGAGFGAAGHLLLTVHIVSI